MRLIKFSTVQYSTVQYSTVQYSTVQYSTAVQYSTVQYSTVQYITVQFFCAMALRSSLGAPSNEHLAFGIEGGARGRANINTVCSSPVVLLPIVFLSSVLFNKHCCCSAAVVDCGRSNTGSSTFVGTCHVCSYE